VKDGLYREHVGPAFVPFAFNSIRCCHWGTEEEEWGLLGDHYNVSHILAFLGNETLCVIRMQVIYILRQPVLGKIRRLSMPETHISAIW